ncbi:MAG: alkaline phosphatase [Anaerolineae bacterium]|nr:alkaline phosphatase [Anaerolineae bacterium]
MRKMKFWMGLMALVVGVMMFGGCAAPTPEIVEVEVTKEVVVTKEVEVIKEIMITPTPMPERHAKYVFLFVGDGMAVAQRNAAELYLGVTKGAGRPEDTTLLMNTFPAQGMNTTYDLKSVIPDSASTGTALATGYKTWSGVISMDAEGKSSYETIAEVAKAHGWKVGVVSSVSIDHATPATFYAHQPYRGNYYEIDQALVASDFDYFAGGPLKRPTGNDKENPAPDLYAEAEKNGFTVARGREEFNALQPGAGKVFVVPDYKIEGNALYYTIDDVPENNISIVDMTRKGIELLDNPDGFFMMVEAGKIDWACHANDAAAAIHDTLALDEAIAVAYEFYEAHPDETLIVVTGDHETGGMTIGFAGTQYSSFVEKIQNQNISQEEFSVMIAEWREAGNVTFEDALAAIAKHFGMYTIPADEKAALEELVLAGEAEDATAEALKAAAEAEKELYQSMALTDLEIQILRQGFEDSMQGLEERADDEYTYLLYGGYEPLGMKVSTILNQKAGISWTSYSHTGIPVQTSAIGVGYEMFNGYYDQTDINAKMLYIAGFSDSMASAK